MTELVRRLAAGLLGLRSDWSDACPAGPPIPDPHRCAGTDCDSVLLPDLPVGAAATVSCLVDPASPGAVKLATLGLLPGVRIALVQRSPAVVLRIGFTELALDAELAARIRVHAD